MLGRTGIQVSPYCLGAMMFGAMGNPDHGESVRIIHRALDAGINFIDTADVYSGGESEEIVGRALKGRRDGVVLASKVHYPMGDDPNHQGNSRRWIITAAENSLRRLQTDHLDLYQVHRPDPAVDVEETLSALSDLIHSGKVRAIGPRRSRPRRSSRRSGPPSGAALSGSARSSRRTRSSTGASSARSCRPASGTGRARWSGARWARACSPAGSGGASRPAPTGRVLCRSTSATSASSTWSRRSSRSPGRPACR
jgi:Aldo/keto reductase family